MMASGRVGATILNIDAISYIATKEIISYQDAYMYALNLAKCHLPPPPPPCLPMQEKAFVIGSHFELWPY